MTQRDKNGRLKKGARLNPSGRPKSDKAFKAMAQKIARGDTEERHRLLEKLWSWVESDDKDKMRAAELLLAYAEGKPVQHQESKVQHDFSKLSDEEMTRKAEEAKEVLGSWTSTRP